MKIRENPKKNRKRVLRQFATVLFAAVLLSVMCLPAFAEELIDPDRAGSISLVMQTSEGEAVGGGTLSLYRVAEVYVDEVRQNTYQLTDDFADSGADLTDLSSGTLADTLASFLEENAPAAYMTAEIGPDGGAVFESLQTGVYYVVQTEAAAGYYAVSPFIVTVPFDVNGTLVYDVDASPKVEAAVSVPSEEPADTTAGTTGKTMAATAATLPQTGAILWPLILVAGIGVVLLIAGALLAFWKKGAMYET